MDLPPHISGRITARRDIASRYWTIRIGCDPRPVFRPGQFATLAVRDRDKMVERPYSIVSSPREAELEFFLQLVPEGALTRRLHALHPGDPIHLRKVTKGTFRFDDTSGRRKHLMVATSTGVAPFVSMLRTFRREPLADHQVFLLHGASDPSQLGYDEELGGLAREVEWFHYVPVISRPREHPGWAGERGRLPGLLSAYAARFGCEPGDTTAYLCGNPRMIKAAKNAVSALGLPPDAVKEERFWVEEKVTTGAPGQTA